MAFKGNGPEITNLNAGNLASGTVAVARGGTGLTSPGAAGNVLTSNGTTWTSVAPAVNGVTSLNGQTGAVVNTDLGAIGSYIVAYYARTNPNTAASGGRHSYVAVDTTLAGSSLRYYNISTQSSSSTYYSATSIGGQLSNSTSAFPTTNTTALTGTWRKVAWPFDGSAYDAPNYYWFQSLWVRIS